MGFNYIEVIRQFLGSEKYDIRNALLSRMIFNEDKYYKVKMKVVAINFFMSIYIHVRVNNFTSFNMSDIFECCRKALPRQVKLKQIIF